jgi:hypothetical protein
VEEARALVDDPLYAAALVDRLGPRKGLAQKTRVLSEERFGDHGRVILDWEGTTRWVAMRKVEGGAWRLTLDEKPVLDALTQGWHQEKVGTLVYHAPRALNEDELRQARELERRASELQQRLGTQLSRIDYYVVDEGPEAAHVIGESFKGSAAARRKLIKAVGVVNHAHELVHVLALEAAGYSTPFLDEGLAAALGSRPQLESARDCERALALLRGAGLASLLDSDGFSAAGSVAQGLAQLTVQGWLERSSEQDMLEVIRAVRSGVPAGTAVKERLQGSVEAAGRAVEEKVSGLCRSFAS